MCNAEFVVHVNPAVFEQVFHQVDHDGPKFMITDAQSFHRFLEHLPGKDGFFDPAAEFDLVLDDDPGTVNVLDVAVGIEVKNIGSLVGESGLAAERNSV